MFDEEGHIYIIDLDGVNMDTTTEIKDKGRFEKEGKKWLADMIYHFLRGHKSYFIHFNACR